MTTIAHTDPAKATADPRPLEVEPTGSEREAEAFAHRCLIDRVKEVIEKEGFVSDALRGIDFLQLFLRMEHWLGRPMSQAEMSGFMNTAVAVNDGPRQLADVIDQEMILLFAQDGCVLFGLGWEDEEDPVREVYARFGGFINVREVFALALESLQHREGDDGPDSYAARRRELVATYTEAPAAHIENLIRCELDGACGRRPSLRLIESFLASVYMAVNMTKEGYDYFDPEEWNRREAGIKPAAKGAA